MLSTLSSLADRNFIVGFVLPALLASLCATWVCSDVPWVHTIWQSILSEKSFSDLTLAVLGVWLLALGLQSMNIFFYQVLEGYYGPRRLQRALLRRQLHLLRLLKRRRLALENQWRTALSAGRRFPRADQEDFASVTLRLTNRFPAPGYLLPTGFGNVIRAFETYPTERYGIDGVAGWIPLQAVIPKDYIGLLDAARAEIDLFVNLVWGALAISALAAGRLVMALDFSALMLRAPSHQVFQALCFGLAGRDAVICGGALATAVGFYKVAKARVPAWGDLVKRAFDLYLPALATQLGAPARQSAAARRAFWTATSRSMIYRARR